MIICYTLPGIWHVTDVIIFHFGYLLPLYPITAQKIKEHEKTPGDIVNLQMYTKNSDQIMHGS